MPPLDVQLTIHDQLWALLEASPSFTPLVKTGNRLKATTQDAVGRDLIKSDPASFPKVRIECNDETDNDRAPKTFGQNAIDYTAATCDYGVPMRLSISVKVVHDSTKLGDQTPVEAAIRGAIFSHGRNLGIAWVTNVVWKGIKRGDESTPDTNNTRRAISKIRLEITSRPKLSQLTAVSFPP